ncbi:hypothetical protein EXN66_Car019108 [Channa argus]|uniref:Uncharacterized protein n=1 Tax=Channa argus TaxID=215402 RepID=A0A6G1QL38_CHAAH|nr:hypothetical protein EXN66_Car019108 [Channa argus]
MLLCTNGMLLLLLLLMMIMLVMIVLKLTRDECCMHFNHVNTSSDVTIIWPVSVPYFC